jgi:hypothetical protein
MSTYRNLMNVLDEMLRERVKNFYVVCAVADITPNDLGSNVWNGIGEALGNLAKVLPNGAKLPDKNNHQAMQILAEYLTIVKLQNDALLVMPNIPEDLRQIMLENGDDLQGRIITMATLE